MWPLIGRDEELELVRRYRSEGNRRSLILTGAPGVGKSRLAAEALREIQGHADWATLAVHVGAGINSLPFGALRVALDLEVRGPDLNDLASSVHDALSAQGSAAHLLILVDDAHLLDDQSAGLLHAMVASGDATLLATLRSGEPAPFAVTALWKDGLADRLELQSLSPLESATLLRAVLGEAIEESTLERLWQVTEGNPLYLREIVSASLETGSLRQVDGEWRWRGGWARASRLQEIVAERLGRLDPDELTIIEALAVGGTLPIEILTDLGPPAALGRLEGRGLVTVTGTPSASVVTIAHPVHAEVVRSGLPALQARSICRNLAGAIERLGAHRPSDQLRLARWSMEAGIPLNTVTLRRAADATLWHIGEAIADRIQEVLPGVAGRAVPVMAYGPDPEGGLRMARAAWEGGGGVEAGTSLAVALCWTGATSEAAMVLEQLHRGVLGSDDRLRVAVALAHVQFWGEHDPEAAVATLARAISDETTDADEVLRAEVRGAWAGIDLNVGRPREAVERSRQAASLEGCELRASTSAPTAAAGLSMSGRCREAIELVDAALPFALEGRGHPLAAAQLLLTRCVSLMRLGQLSEGIEMGQSLRQIAMDVDSLDGTAVYGLAVADGLMIQGRPASALRFYRDAAGLLSERDVLGYLPWALAGVARARAYLGDDRGSRQALDAANQASVTIRYFEQRLFMGRVALLAAMGRHTEAARMAQAGADWCADAGMAVEEALLLDMWLRQEPSDEVTARLARLPDRTDSPLVGLIAQRADALHRRHPGDLLIAASELAGMEVWLMAAEAAAAAAGILSDRGRNRESAGAARQALTWYSRCEGARSALLERLEAPSTLTARELEVARLAALGQSSKEIADRLVLSIRTVDAHLYRAYAKLGVHTRAELARELGLETQVG